MTATASSQHCRWCLSRDDFLGIDGGSDVPGSFARTGNCDRIPICGKSPLKLAENRIGCVIVPLFKPDRWALQDRPLTEDAVTAYIGKLFAQRESKTNA